MFPLKGFLASGAGPGLVPIFGSFTESSTGAIINQRPSKSNCTITKLASGVYQVAYQEAGLSLVYAGANLGAATNLGTPSYTTAVIGYTQVSQDFMSGGATAYAADATQTKVVIQVIAAANNALSTIYALGNTGSKPNYRCSFCLVFATASYNQ